MPIHVYDDLKFQGSSAKGRLTVDTDLGLLTLKITLPFRDYNKYKGDEKYNFTPKIHQIMPSHVKQAGIKLFEFAPPPIANNMIQFEFQQLISKNHLPSENQIAQLIQALQQLALPPATLAQRPYRSLPAMGEKKLHRLTNKLDKLNRYCPPLSPQPVSNPLLVPVITTASNSSIPLKYEAIPHPPSTTTVVARGLGLEARELGEEDCMIFDFDEEFLNKRDERSIEPVPVEVLPHIPQQDKVVSKPPKKSSNNSNPITAILDEQLQEDIHRLLGISPSDSSDKPRRPPRSSPL